ncbi:MAG: hypothetical protein DRG78_01030 [Epsilonproteobacteria bacterium]|nr:MAG: hypothetical protein DRG78_01030 [Campylobacterota bacterium]
MTFKKSIISIATIALVASTITGCGGYSSNGGSDPITSVEVVDGKVLNAKATAHYFDDNNKAQTIALENNSSFTNVLTHNKTKGTFAYTVPESNMSIINKIRYISVESLPLRIVNGLAYDASYIDVDLSKDYNASIDMRFNKTYVAVKGVKYISPISTLVYSVIKDDLNNHKKTISSTEISTAIETIASKLNLSATDLKSADPLAEGKEEFGFINAMLGNMTKDELLTLGTKISAEETEAKDLSSVIDMLAKNVPSTQNTLFNALNANVKSGAITVESLRTLNFDHTRKANGKPVLQTVLKTTIGNIESINVDTIEAIATGDKYGAGTINFIFAQNDDAKDANASGLVDLLFSAHAPKDTMLDTDSIVNKIVIKLSNIGVKRDINGITTFDTDMTNVTTSYEWYGEELYLDTNIVSKIDLNSSFVSTAGIITATSINLATLISSVEANLTTETNASVTTAFINNKIVTMKVALVDDDNILQLVDPISKNGRIWTTTAITSHEINGEGKSLINATLDSRGSNATARNTAPTLTTINGEPSGSYFVIDQNASATPVSISYPVVTALELSEQNNTVTFSNIPSWMTFNTGSKLVSSNNASDVQVADFNVTINKTSFTNDENTTLFVTVTDEFGKESDEYNISYFYNALPTIAKSANFAETGFGPLNLVSGSSNIYTIDLNVTVADESTAAIKFDIANLIGGDSGTDTIDIVGFNSGLSQPSVDINTTTGRGYILFSVMSEEQQNDIVIHIDNNSTMFTINVVH